MIVFYILLMRREQRMVREMFFLLILCYSTHVVIGDIFDILPVISQLKSAVQAIAGDTEGARRTQENFSRGCPVVSQLRSAGEAIGGNAEAAKKTQEYFVNSMGSLADGIPVVGHVKGVIHYAAGDKEGGDQAMKSASRTVGVVGGGAVGLLVGGPVGAITGGVVGGAAMDGITTGVDSAVHGEYRPAGNVALVTNLVEDKSSSKSGDIFDLVAGVAMDGMAGRAGGKISAKAIDRINNQRVYRVMKKEDAVQAIKQQQLPKIATPEGETWTSESINRHQKNYLKHKNEMDPTNKYTDVQIKLRKSDYETIKQEAIPQKNSGAINRRRKVEGDLPKNLINNERLADHPHGKVNLGIKGEANLDSFNSKIVDIREVNPNSIQYSNTVTKHIGTYGAPASVGIITAAIQSEGDPKHERKKEL